jgi:sugar phosphate isomerase/epimerase
MTLFLFKTALNTSTLRPFKLDVKQQIQVAAEAGYDGIELWMKDIEAFVKQGGTLKELRVILADAGIALINAIAFIKWADADGEVRSAAIKQAEQEMSMLAELGCSGIAMPPFGQVEGVTLDAMAVHFAEMMELGRKLGIEPILEFWGRAKQLSKLSEAVYVAMETGWPDVKILIDPFHMYTGGSDVNSLSYLDGRRIGVVHVNDYPSRPPRETIADRDRVFPGDGVAPSAKFAELLTQNGYRGYLSLELFMDNLGAKGAVEVAVSGLKNIKKFYQTP